MPGECRGSWYRNPEKPRSPRTGQLHHSRPCHRESIVHPSWGERFFLQPWAATVYKLNLSRSQMAQVRGEDAGNNFFLSADSIGKSRGEVAVR